jgi:leucyl aminopeptidase
MMDGTTVEVISTDAEGRLVLGDGVTWAVRQGVDAVVDMATLTRANVVALGGIRSGLISNNSELAERVKAACEAAAEPTWELPHDEDYQDLIKTSAADIKNSGGRPAGTVTAGLFIGHFAQDTPWAHLDIAGLSFSGEGGSIGAGATGYGVASLVELCRSWAQ